MWYVWRGGEIHKKFWWGKQKGRYPLVDVDMGGRMILKQFFKKQKSGECRLDSYGLGKGQTMGCCELSDELKSNLRTVQQDATYSVYYIYVGSSTCFGC